MLVRIQNKIGVSVDIPHFDEKAYRYCEFYINFAGQVICQNIAKKREVVKPPYTIIKRFLGTDRTQSTEVKEDVR